MKKIFMSKSGFTLLELVIVTLVMITIAVIFSISFFPTYSIKLDGALNKLVFDIRRAQQTALSREVFCGLNFNVAEDTYTIYLGDRPFKGGGAASKVIDRSEYNGYLEGVNIVSTNFGNDIWFDVFGVPYDSSGNKLVAAGVVTLQHGDTSRNVNIVQNTGEVKL